MVCFGDRKTLMRSTEQLEKKVIPISSTDHIVDFNKFCSISLLFCFVLFCFFQQDFVTRSRSHHNEKGIRHFKGNIETFVRIIIDSGLSEIFCLQNL